MPEKKILFVSNREVSGAVYRNAKKSGGGVRAH